MIRNFRMMLVVVILMELSSEWHCVHIQDFIVCSSVK